MQAVLHSTLKRIVSMFFSRQDLYFFPGILWGKHSCRCDRSACSPPLDSLGDVCGLKLWMQRCFQALGAENRSDAASTKVLAGVNTGQTKHQAKGRGWSAAGVSWPTFSWEVTLLCFSPTAGFSESWNKLNYSFIWFLFRTRERERANTPIQFSRQRLSVGEEAALFSLGRLRRSLIVFAGTRPRPSRLTWSTARKPPRSSIVIIVVGLLARDEFEWFNVEICYEYVDRYKYNLLVIIVTITN